MMDAATAASMSDPDSNKWFRRRWQETEVKPVHRAVPMADAAADLEVTGRALREQWRRERTVGAGTLQPSQ
jgi:hypothetical protein